MTTEQNNHVLTAINAAMVSFTQQIVEQATKPLIERIDKLEREVVTLNTALNTLIFTYTPQMSEKSTNPLLQRIRQIELDVEALDNRTQFCLQENANTSVNIAIAAVKQDVVREVLDIVQTEVLKANVLDAMDDKIDEAINNITVESITGFSHAIEEAVEEALQNQPPISADDIDGIKEFVDSVIADSDADLDSNIREEVESQLEQHDPIDKIKRALRNAADSL